MRETADEEIGGNPIEVPATCGECYHLSRMGRSVYCATKRTPTDGARLELLGGLGEAQKAPPDWCRLREFKARFEAIRERMQAELAGVGDDTA